MSVTQYDLPLKAMNGTLSKPATVSIRLDGVNLIPDATGGVEERLREAVAFLLEETRYRVAGCEEVKG